MSTFTTLTRRQILEERLLERLRDADPPVRSMRDVYRIARRHPHWSCKDITLVDGLVARGLIHDSPDHAGQIVLTPVKDDAR